MKPLPRRLWRADLLAGLAVAVVVLPEGVAYAAIAGVPPLHALAAALVGLVVYALLGSSRQAVVTPTSSAAAVFATAVGLGGPDQGFALVLLTGALLLLAAALRADFLGAFISRPVLRGFAWALALTIVVKQLPHLLNVPSGGGHDLVGLLTHLWAQRAGWDWRSLAVGLAALALWVLLHRSRGGRGAAPSLLVLLAGVALTYWPPVAAWQLADIGALQLDGLGLHWPSLTREQWLAAAQMAPALALIVFAESWGSVRTLALRRGDTVQPRRELWALGSANVASALVQGLPVGAGFSAAQVSDGAGARSRRASLWAALALAVLVLAGQALLSRLPLAVLAAVIVGILSHALWPAALLAHLRAGRDGWTALLAAGGVLVLGVAGGMVLAVAVSLALALARLAQPRLTALGRLPGTRDYVDRARHAEAEPPPPGVLILRPEVPLFFANAEPMLAAARERALAAQARVLVLSLEASDELDSTAAEALAECRARLHQRGVHLVLARVKDGPRAALAHTAPDLAAFYWSVDDAVAAG